MDRRLREAEQAYFQYPGDPRTLLRYWSERVRAGLPLDLLQLKPIHSYYPVMESLLLRNQHLIQASGVPLSSYQEGLTSIIFEELFDDYEDHGSLHLSEIKIIYMGWLPDFFSLSESDDPAIRAQVSCPGLLVLVQLPRPEGVGIESATSGMRFTFVTHRAFYFSLYAHSGAMGYPPYGIATDVEALFIGGLAHLQLIKSLRCSNSRTFNGERSKPILIEGNIETVKDYPGLCYPLIDIFNQIADET